MVEFKKRAIKAQWTEPLKYKRKYEKKSKKTGFFVKSFLLLVWLWTMIAIIGFCILYVKYIKPLPPVDQLETLAIPEASIIYDGEWNELYTFYWEEKRTYVEYDKISQNMINAIVAWEDQNFFENKWVDFYRMWWAVFQYLIWDNDEIEWTSTISQQLIRNTLIWNERKIERKIKEMYLSYKMNTKLSKSKIMELYLNKISFWSNAYGIEQAAKTFFWKQATELTTLESSILASLPKGPTFYSPYRHYDRTVWVAYAYNNENPDEILNILSQKERVIYTEQLSTLKELIWGLQWQRLSEKELLLCGIKTENYKKSINVDKDGCKLFKYSDLLGVLNNFIVEWEKDTVEYQTWRKDFILGRMLEENYITFEEYQDAILWAFWYEFKAYKEDIQYPHFVFYVKEFLVEKYGQELIEQWGLKIYTSLEPVLQNKAQEIVNTQIAQNTALYWAKNASLISIDNRTWNIVTMIWWGDYYDTENKWNVNIATSPLQPGSSFKPFVYALAIDKNSIGTKTPVYDVETTFQGNPPYTPSNFDGKFKWKMTLTSALNNSRNIPAIKMYYLAWGQASIVDFVNTIWGSSLKAWQYWPSLALGTGLMSPLDLAISYSTFANMWYKKEITPIRKIEDSRGNIIEETNAEKNIWELVMDQSLAYIMNFMLSDSGERPEYWNKFLTLRDRKVAAKTGTSTFQYKENWEDVKLPRNLWTAWYTPQYTTVVWAWNTDWKPLWEKWNGLEWAWPIWKKFMDYVHIWESVLNWQQPEGVKQASISNISWLLPWKSTSSNYIISSLFKNLPDKYDNSFTSVQYDALCNWRVTNATPEGAIRTWVFIALNSLKPNLPSWENPVQAWARFWWLAIVAAQSWGNILSSPVGEPCQNRTTYEWSEIQLGTSLRNWDTVSPGNNSIEIWYKNSNPLSRIEFYVGSELAQTIDAWWATEWVIRPSFYVPTNGNSVQLRIRAIDSLFYAQDRSITLNIAKDNQAPQISILNPSSWSISIYEWDSFNLRASIQERSELRTVNVYLNGSILSTWTTNRQLVYPINQGGSLAPGTYSIVVEAVDQSFNKGSRNVSVTVLAGTNPNWPLVPQVVEEDVNESLEQLIPDETEEPKSTEAEAPALDQPQRLDSSPAVEEEQEPVQETAVEAEVEAEPVQEETVEPEPEAASTQTDETAIIEEEHDFSDHKSYSLSSSSNEETTPDQLTVSNDE